MRQRSGAALGPTFSARSATRRDQFAFAPSPAPLPVDQNLAICADALEALPRLFRAMRAQIPVQGVSVVFIDPPYNVGGPTEYRNQWVGRSLERFAWAGEHGAYLEFLEPRLELARELMTATGVMFVTIGEQEHCFVKLLLDRIFGEAQHLGTLIWNKMQGSGQGALRRQHEYILLYAKDFKRAPRLTRVHPGSMAILHEACRLKDDGQTHREAERLFRRWLKEAAQEDRVSANDALYDRLHPVTFRPFQAAPSGAQDKDDLRCKIPLLHPLTKRPCPIPARGWKWNSETLSRLSVHDDIWRGDDFVLAGEFCFGLDHTTIPRRILYLDEHLSSALPTVLSIPATGPRELPPGVTFSTPKPLALLKTLMASYPDPQAVILDCFAGSGTTAQAVEELNHEDHGARRWVLVEEMPSTFNNALLPRLAACATAQSFHVRDFSTVRRGPHATEKKREAFGLPREQ